MAEKYEISNKSVTQKNEAVRVMTDVKFYPSVMDETFAVAKYTKLPLSRIPALGTALEPLMKAVQNVFNGGEATSGLYKVVIPKGTHLAEFKSGAGNLGTVLNANNQIAGQATLNPMIFDPSTVFMAAALANIDRKLDAIQEVQLEILGFLVQKERSELSGDLNFLVDVLNNYKFNWDNDKYKNNNHIKVLDIRQTAERKIDFYKEQILSKINKKSFFHSDQDVKKKIEKIQSDLKDYQLSIYLYSFSSFLEVMLLENFDSVFLSGISEKIENYSHKYRKTYTKCYDLLERYAKSSIQSNMLKGLANINKVAGKTVGKIPVINKSQIDEVLIGTGKKLGEFGSMRTEQAVKQLIEKQSAYVQSFVENINMVNKLYNQSIELIFDEENIYIGTIEE